MGGCDGIVATGVDNFTYLTGVVLPFASNYPDRQALVVKTRDNRDHIICPFDWSDSVRDQGWRGSLSTYNENANLPPDAIIQALADALPGLGLAGKNVGFDKQRTSSTFVETLTRKLPNVRWTACDDQLRNVRIVKTKEEIELLEAASKHSESGIISALNHLEGTVDVPGYSIAEFSERVRVHVYEFGGSGVGYLATMQGTDAQSYYARSPELEMFRNGELFRIEVTNHNRGYWSNAARMAVIGRPSKEQVTAYTGNLTLKESAIRSLKAGSRSQDVFEEVMKTAQKEHIKFWEDVGIGYGVGVSEREPPYLYRNDNTVLANGMVVVLDIYTYGPHQELIHSKDTFEILENGSRLLSWYRSWDELYAVTGIRSTH